MNLLELITFVGIAITIIYIIIIVIGRYRHIQEKKLFYRKENGDIHLIGVRKNNEYGYEVSVIKNIDGKITDSTWVFDSPKDAFSRIEKLKEEDAIHGNVNHFIRPIDGVKVIKIKGETE